MGRLDHKVAIVTGGATGMGEAHVRALVAEGAKLLFTDVLEDAGNALAEELGPAARFARADVASEADWTRIVATVEEAFGGLDILVNNAGVALHVPIEETTLEAYRRVVDINQIGTFLGMKAVIPALRRRGGGSIVNISSVAGLVGHAMTVAYAASKHAVRGMTKVAASELGQDNIRVNSVHPGTIMTPMLAAVRQETRDGLASKVPLGRIGRPEEVSDLILFLASDASTYCSGGEFLIDGGLLTT